MKNLFSHVKNLNDYFINVPFHTAKKGASHYISILTSTSYKIYDCRKLHVIFQGPLLESPILINAYNDYIITYNGILKFCFRGVIVHEFEEMIDDFLVFGDYIVSLYQNKILLKNIEILNEHEIKLTEFLKLERESIIKILHPPTYINKILIVSNDKIEIYNIKKQKTIYTIKFEGIINAFNTPVLDLILLQCADKFIIYNLKSDEAEFELEISKTVKSISFSTKQPLMLATNENDMWLYNLEERRVVKRYDEKVIHAAFLYDEDIIAISTKSTIKLLTLEDYNMKLLKIRKILLNPKFLGVSNNDIVLGNENEVILVNLHKEELNYIFSIKNFKGADRIYIEGEKIIIFSQNNIYSLDKENKNGKCIVESYKESIRDVTISTCGNFSVLVTQTNNIVLYNLDSKMIYTENKKDKHVLRVFIDTFKNKVIIVYADLIEICDRNFNAIKNIEADNIIDTKYIGNFFVILHTFKIVFYDVETLKISRVFELKHEASNFCISSDILFLIVCTKQSTFVYDIKTTNLIESNDIISNYAINTLNNEFLCILSDGIVKCLYNNSFFDESLLLNQKIESLALEQNDQDNNIDINTFDDLIQSNIIDSYRSLGPEKFNRLVVNNIDRVDQLYNHLMNYLDADFEKIQVILNEMLKRTHKKISPEVAKKFYEKYITIYDVYYEEYTKAIAYAKFEDLSLE